MRQFPSVRFPPVSLLKLLRKTPMTKMRTVLLNMRHKAFDSFPAYFRREKQMATPMMNMKKG